MPVVAILVVVIGDWRSAARFLLRGGLLRSALLAALREARAVTVRAWRDIWGARTLAGALRGPIAQRGQSAAGKTEVQNPDYAGRVHECRVSVRSKTRQLELVRQDKP